MLLGRDLVAGHLEDPGRRPDEGDPSVRGGLREIGVLREEAVAGVDGIGARLPGDPDDLGDVEVGPHGMPRLPDLVRLVGLEPVHRVAILVREYGDRRRTQLVGGAEGTDGDLTTVGYEDLLEHAVPSC